MKEKIGQMFEKLKVWWIWLKSKFIRLYKLKVSYNNVWGDSDDQAYIIKKVIKQNKYMIKFRTEDGDVVEIHGAEGLNIRIEEM